VIYCPECGTANAAENESCTNCQTALPKLTSAPPASGGPAMVPVPPPAEKRRPPTALAKIPRNEREEIVVDTSANVYCPDCGATNSPQGRRCKQCGMPLPNAGVSSPYRRAATPYQAGSWWQQRSPAFRAAVLIGAAVLVLQAIDASGVGALFSAPFHVAAYFAQGLMVGKYMRDDPRYYQASYVRQGFISALWRIAIGIGIAIFLLFVGGIVTAGVGLALFPILIATTIFADVLNVGLTGLGAWIYGKTGGKNLALISVGVFLAGTLLACGLAVVMLAIVGVSAWATISYFWPGVILFTFL